MKQVSLNFIGVVLLVSLLASTNLYSQSLAPGQIAFIGYNTDTPDGFSIITLMDVPGTEQIYFTDKGIKSASEWGPTTEGTFLFTAPAAGIPCGTVISFVENVADVITISGVTGASYTVQEGSFNMASGDQMMAYQKTTLGISLFPNVDTTFIAGVHGDYNSLKEDPVTKWSLSAQVTSTADSIVPPGLTNGDEAVSLFPGGPVELDNAKYTGTLTGTDVFLLALMNDYNNWSSDNVTPYDISPASYSPSVTCTTTPVELQSFSID